MKHLVAASLSKNGIHVDAEGGVTIPSKLGSDYRLGRIEGAATDFKLRYLEERWHYFNKHLFGGSMRVPNFVISKAKRTLGVWRAGKREFELGVRMFLLREDKETLNTIIHEMCHQYVSEVLKVRNLEEMGPTGHGPAWQNTMAAVGLPTGDKFEGHPDVITKKEVLDRRDEKIDLLKKHQERQTIDWESPSNPEYMLVRYISPGRDIDCPAIVEPREALPMSVPARLIGKSGNVVKQGRVMIDHCVIPGPLKIKTPSYRAAQALLDKMNGKSS
jgi:hypothetical protein